MKRILIFLITAVAAVAAQAQESKEVYSFLRLPVSAHVAALGGDNISLSDDDPTVIFHNPALISNVSDKSINLNFMTYMEGSTTASASFVKAVKERATWGVSAQFMAYGSIKETNADNVETGTFSPKDIALAGSFAYMLSNKISGGITARLISSTIGSYSSAAVAVDLGANYYDAEHGWSVSAVAKNLGGQVKAYNDDFERIPLDLQVGLTKRLIGSPLTLHATLSRLNNWEQDFIKHLAVGADINIGQTFYIAAGYNFRRSSEMKITEDDGDSNHGAGISLGAGVQLERFKLQLAYAKYHVSASSLLVSVTYSL
ncbi:MAG: type IX secretion system protein PorQ [Prevotella sp.]|nr:type IX secretion system protein PorQ [Prevotella sp.]MBQ9186929.1 type IX secretion system protein PorQ [Prevotella sp.]